MYYPYYEQDLALGQIGIQSGILHKDRPKNYVDVFEIEGKIPIFADANGDARCDLINPITKSCSITNIGDNHIGYAGFRDPINRDRLQDIGTIGLVVHDWRNYP